MDLKAFGRRVETEGKALLRSALVRVLPVPPKPDGPLDPAGVTTVLAVRQDARLGNLLLLTPALRLLREAFPAARVEVLLSDRYGDALAFNPCVDAVLRLKDIPALRRRGCALAIDFSPQHAFSLSSAVWTALSGAPRRVAFLRGDASRFMTDLVPVPGRQAHETANLAALVRGVARGAPLPPDSSLRTEWHFGPGEKDEGARLWKEKGLDGRTVALFLGARAEKRIDPAWFVELGSRLVRAGLKAALAGGPAEAKLLEGRKIPEGVVVLPQLPLRRFAAAIANARAVLSADTGPMHLAVALGVPTVELFSHTEPWRFGYGHLPPHRVLETPGRHPTLEEAWAALKEVLSKPRG